MEACWLCLLRKTADKTTSTSGISLQNQNIIKVVGSYPDPGLLPVLQPPVLGIEPWADMFLPTGLPFVACPQGLCQYLVDRRGRGERSGALYLVSSSQYAILIKPFSLPVSFIVFEIWSHVAQAGLKLAINPRMTMKSFLIRPQPAEFLDDRCVCARARHHAPFTLSWESN